jgi:nifR3 family TIM-barrel protein
VPSLDLSRWRSLAAHGVIVDFPFFLAPMVGLSHVALRETVRAYFPDGARTLLFTEMLSSRRLPSEVIGIRTETVFDATEDNLVPQLVGNEDRFVAASATRLGVMCPRAIDINMGCPVGRAIHHRWGVALMGDPAQASRVVRAAIGASRWPVSVKLRTGLTDDPEYLIDFARMLEEAGAAWLTLHPRVAAQQRRGVARWDYISRVREAVRIPVVGNGSVQTSSDALRMLSETGCDGVMIGRAAVARPWIFWQIGEALGMPAPREYGGRSAPAEPFMEGRELGAALARFVGIATNHFVTRDVLERLRFHASWAGRWLDFGHELGRRLARAGDVVHVSDVLADFFSVPQRMSARTSLN